MIDRSIFRNKESTARIFITANKVVSDYGVNTTSDNDVEIEGNGVFVDKLSERLTKDQLSIPLLGLKSTDDIVTKIKIIL